MQKVYRIKLAQRRIKKRIAISQNFKSRFLLEPAITTTNVKYALKWRFGLRSEEIELISSKGAGGMALRSNFLRISSKVNPIF